MFESIMKSFKKFTKKEDQTLKSKDTAKERLHLVLMQDRANVSADFLDLMKQEIIEVIKKYIDIDEKAMDVRLTNKENSDGTNGAPALYANIPILNIKDETRQNAKIEPSKVIKEEKEIFGNNIIENTAEFEQQEITTNNIEPITIENTVKEDIKIEKELEDNNYEQQVNNNFQKTKYNNFPKKHKNKNFKKHKNRKY